MQVINYLGCGNQFQKSRCIFGDKLRQIIIHFPVITQFMSSLIQIFFMNSQNLEYGNANFSDDFQVFSIWLSIRIWTWESKSWNQIYQEKKKKPSIVNFEFYRRKSTKIFALLCFNSSISNKATDTSWVLRIEPARTGVPVSYVQLLFFPTEQQEFRQMYVINSEMLICTADERLNNSIVIKLKLFIPCKQSVLYFTPHFKIYHDDRFPNVRILYQKNSKKFLSSCCLNSCN